MDQFIALIWLLPIIFMIHDFEEIIFMKSWFNKNGNYLAERFPKIGKKLVSLYNHLTTAGFALAVAEEFVLLSLITVGSIVCNNYVLWLAVFMGFFLHLLIHLVQWIMVKRYIPAIYTSLFALIYCGYTFYFIIINNIFQLSEIILWSVIGCVFMGMNLVLAHKLAGWFNKKIELL
jgi:hypothetical protein